jgi:hypothetical protein
MNNTYHPLCDGKGCYKCDPNYTANPCPVCGIGKLSFVNNEIEYGKRVDCNNCNNLFMAQDKGGCLE